PDLFSPEPINIWVGPVAQRLEQATHNRKTPFLLFFAGYGYRYFVQCLQGLSPLFRFAAFSDFLPRKPQPVSDCSIRFSMNRPIQGAESGVLRLGPATITRR